MGTRNQVTIIHEQKKYDLYGQFDGYLDGVGKGLVNELILKPDLIENLKQRLNESILITNDNVKEIFEQPKKLYILNIKELSEDSIKILESKQSKIKNVEETYRFYDRVDEAIVKYASGLGNFLYLKLLTGSDYNIYIEYHYIIDLDNQVFEEKTNNISIKFENIKDFFMYLSYI